ncbi:hypothetical protein BDW72DRAFT_197192 [Aspergillus terricola var. indicus]
MDVDDYTTVPLTLLDSTVGNTDIIARISLVADAPLSFDKLQESWYHALQARPILQARLRRSRTAPSGLEYHVFTPKGMAKYLERQKSAPDHLKDFFCLDESHRSITDYCGGFGVGPSAPSHSYKVFVADAANPEDEKRCTAFNGVQNLQELLESDRPQITVQVTRFKDATLITFSVSHIIGDLFTMQTLFKSWEAALHGHPLPPFEDLGKDPFTAYGPGGRLAGKGATSSSPPLPPGWRVYGVFDKVRFLYRFLWDCHISRPEKTITPKYVFISDAEVSALQAQAERDLAQLEAKRRQSNSTGTPLKVSRSNLLFAWLLKQTNTHLGPNEIITPITIVNARARPPTGMADTDFPNHNFYGAALPASLSALRVRELMAMPIGELAFHIREGIIEASSPENTKNLLAFSLNNTLWSKPSGKMALFSPPNHSWAGLTDWRAGKLHDVDFTPARLDGNATGTGADNAKVTICGITCHMITAFTQRDRWACMGDAAGGTWFWGAVADKQWSDQRGFGRYPHLHKRASKL